MRFAGKRKRENFEKEGGVDKGDVVLGEFL